MHHRNRSEPLVEIPTTTPLPLAPALDTASRVAAKVRPQVVHR
jgi:hypothetical protein